MIFESWIFILNNRRNVRQSQGNLKNTKNLVLFETTDDKYNNLNFAKVLGRVLAFISMNNFCKEQLFTILGVEAGEKRLERDVTQVLMETSQEKLLFVLNVLEAHNCARQELNKVCL